MELAPKGLYFDVSDIYTLNFLRMRRSAEAADSSDESSFADYFFDINIILSTRRPPINTLT